MPGNVVKRQKAQVSLRILVVGGNIGGLATAYALQSAGHRVVVLEQNDGKARSHGGLRSPPNMTRVLARWGLEPYLNELGVKCPRFTFKRGETGQLIGLLKLHEEFLADLMANFYFIQHGDLQSIMLDLALREGVDVRWNSKVVGVHCQPMYVVLDSGETMHADLVVGADGPRSLVRSVVLGGEKVEAKSIPSLCLTCSVPTDLMVPHDDLRPFTENSDWSYWLGDNFMMNGSLISGRREYSITLAVRMDPDQAAVYGDDWKGPYTIDQFNIDIERFDPSMRKLLRMAKNIIPVAYFDRPHVESLTCEAARIVIVGEAAHPMMPSGLHPTALAIEDAETLGSLFSRLQHADEVPRLLSAYEELRQARCNMCLEWEKRKRDWFTIPYGPEQVARDARIRRGAAYEQWDHMNEHSFREMWGDECEMYAYDAAEKVDDWWTKWGSFMTRPRADSGLGPPVTPTLEVSISKDG